MSIELAINNLFRCKSKIGKRDYGDDIGDLPYLDGAKSFC